MNDNLLEFQVKDNKIYAPLKEKWLDKIFILVPVIPYYSTAEGNIYAVIAIDERYFIYLFTIEETSQSSSAIRGRLTAKLKHKVSPIPKQTQKNLQKSSAIQKKSVTLFSMIIAILVCNSLYFDSMMLQ